MKLSKKVLIQSLIVAVGSLAVFQIFASDPKTQTKKLVIDIERVENLLKDLKEQSKRHLDSSYDNSSVYSLPDELDELQQRLNQQKIDLIEELNIESAKTDGAGGV